uniref:Uncharacterized protein n=1 Tax=Phytophthora ramorum TaxID=164328 RepID=H3GPT5_PHYRM
MATTLKKCLKLHKLFMAEVARSSRLESEGSQVLASLANTGGASLNDNDDADGSVQVMGVLSYSSNSQNLLLQKHFLALEKSRGFLADILRDFQEFVKGLRSLTSDCVTLVDDALGEGENAATAEDEMAAVIFPLQLQEWMETVLAMFEHEVLRKTRLVADLEYSDTWSAKGAMGNVDDDYGEYFRFVSRLCWY